VQNALYFLQKVCALYRTLCERLKLTINALFNALYFPGTVRALNALYFRKDVRNNCGLQPIESLLLTAVGSAGSKQCYGAVVVAILYLFSVRHFENPEYF